MCPSRPRRRLGSLKGRSNRVDEQAKRHFRRVAGVIDQLLRTDGYDVLLATAVMGTGGSARQIAADLMSEEYIAAAKLRLTPPPPDQGSCE